MFYFSVSILMTLTYMYRKTNRRSASQSVTPTKQSQKTKTPATTWTPNHRGMTNTMEHVKHRIPRGNKKGYDK